MPTGTLCAERNAIGNALAADQSIGRGDMLAVAVLRSRWTRTTMRPRTTATQRPTSGRSR